MPRFKVFRHKRYVAFVDASSPKIAIAMAADVRGRDWQLVEDEVSQLAEQVGVLGPVPPVAAGGSGDN